MVEFAYPYGRGNVVSICVRVEFEPAVRQFFGCGFKVPRHDSAFCPCCFRVGWWFVDVELNQKGFADDCEERRREWCWSSGLVGRCAETYACLEQVVKFLVALFLMIEGFEALKCCGKVDCVKGVRW